MSQEIIDRVTSVIGGFDSRVQSASADAWTKQSPCADWKARDVVVHVGNNLLSIGAALSGGQSREIADDEDIVAAWGEARDSFLGALPTADLSVTLPGPFGPMPADQIIGRLVSTDTLVHTWDLARATDGDETLDQAVVEQAYSGVKPLDAMLRQSGLFGDRIESPSGASTQTEFLNFLGRTV